MTDLAIIPECYIDTNLTETVLQGVEVNHQKGCNNVSKTMREKLRNDFAVGIIDRDKREIDYFREFDLIKETNHLALYKHPDRHHYFIQIIPAMEGFILQAMDSAGLEKSAYGIPDSFDRFRKLTKTIDRKSDPVFKKLFKKLVREETPQVIMLKGWLTYLHEKTYNADLAELRAI